VCYERAQIVHELTGTTTLSGLALSESGHDPLFAVDLDLDVRHVNKHDEAKALRTLAPLHVLVLLHVIAFADLVLAACPLVKP
jgi:hypothetical protein